MSEELRILPKAIYQGKLQLGGNEVDCYVLENGDRVISIRAAVRAMAKVESGNIKNYIGIKALQAYISVDQIEASMIDFEIPGMFNARGLTAETFLSICQAYVTALNEGHDLTERQRDTAVQCAILLSACAKIGLIALIDEATGYQYEREENALQVKLRAYVADELREWEKTFPDELWHEFGRLTHWKGVLHQRPKYWGLLVMELIYEALDPDVADYLKNNKPKPRHGLNYHQWMSSDYGLRKLDMHIQQIIGIAKTCETMRELKDKVAHHYKKVPLQLTMTLMGDPK